MITTICNHEITVSIENYENGLTIPNVLYPELIFANFGPRATQTSSAPFVRIFS